MPSSSDAGSRGSGFTTVDQFGPVVAHTTWPTPLGQASAPSPACGLGVGELTPEAHFAHLSREFAQEAGAKYERGQREHGGQLWRKRGMLTCAIEEAHDQVVYLQTLRGQIENEAGRLALLGGDVGAIAAELRQWLLETEDS